MKKKFTRQQYEENVKKRGLKPVRKDNYKGVHVFISDGFQKKSTPFFDGGAHYQTEWAIATTDDCVDVAQPIFYQHLTDPLGLSVHVDKRVKEAIDVAKAFIDKCDHKQDFVRA